IGGVEEPTEAVKAVAVLFGGQIGHSLMIRNIGQYLFISLEVGLAQHMPREEKQPSVVPWLSE
ncbi:hypothetical protein A2U01_0063513, partial [Trifolium medium]|nr:hypothetical protein [Trifolium medium]